MDLFETLAAAIKPNTKTYILKLLTLSGPKTEYYKDSQPLEQFESELIRKYGQFTQLSCKEIK